MEGVIERTVARLNIEHYKRLLRTETDETTRQMVKCLLAEEEAKLRGLAEPDAGRGSRGPPPNEALPSNGADPVTKPQASALTRACAALIWKIANG